MAGVMMVVTEVTTVEVMVEVMVEETSKSSMAVTTERAMAAETAAGLRGSQGIWQLGSIPWMVWGK